MRDRNRRCMLDMLGVPRQSLELVDSLQSRIGALPMPVRVWLAAKGLTMSRRGYSLRLPMLSVTCIHRAPPLPPAIPLHLARAVW